MLVYVPQYHVALVYVGAELRTVLEAGLSCLAPLDGMSVHYVDLQAAPCAPHCAEALEAVH
jgi:hypothetical protein